MISDKLRVAVRRRSKAHSQPLLAYVGSPSKTKPPSVLRPRIYSGRAREAGLKLTGAQASGPRWVWNATLANMTGRPQVHRFGPRIATKISPGERNVSRTALAGFTRKQVAVGALVGAAGVAAGYALYKRHQTRRPKPGAGSNVVSRPLTGDYLAQHNLTHGKGGRFTAKGAKQT